MGQACIAASFCEGVPEGGSSTAVRTTRRMGWKPDLPDFRDKLLAFPKDATKDLPAKVDLRPAEHVSIYDQGHLGSCTANAISAAFQFNLIKEGKRDFTPSRLFIYYNERSMEGSVDRDAGAQIRDGMKSINAIGVCDEVSWPYDIAKFKERPSSACYTEAAENRATSYARVPQTLEDLKGCLNDGFPFVLGFMVFSSFMTEEVKTTGYMLMPSPYDQLEGGHAVVCCGYDDVKKFFIVRNSWGEKWGDKGYFYMPYDYMVMPGLVRDIWTIRFVDRAVLRSTSV